MVSETTLLGVGDARLLTADQAGSLLGMSAKALRRADQAGKIPQAIRIGRNVRWDRLELEAWVDARCPDRQTWEVIRNGG